ncbi:MAG: DNA-3-methyladenine glycosylase 2 family protein [Butyrivibrio sp.]|nr:DNA-3-methyladenine glycosylase 2 family protein [Butyrivibrio sp.]
MIININDDFDPKKIQVSGQCFRVKEVEEGLFRFITGEHVVYIRKIAGDALEKSGKGRSKAVKKCKSENSSFLEVSCSQEEWDSVWHEYFDLDRNYGAICKKEYGKNDFVDKTIDFGRGLRILKQDKWEMLVTFIISQRKSIPAIASAVEKICERFGEKIETDVLMEGCGSQDGCDLKAGQSLVRETIYSFPRPKKMLSATPEDLAACGLGYRAPYVRDAVEKVCSGELDLDALDLASDDELFESLMSVHGVGKKVANCVCLFAYMRTSRVPVDVWISRAIEEEFGGEDLFPMYGENGGIIQQYVFYFEKNA